MSKHQQEALEEYREEILGAMKTEMDRIFAEVTAKYPVVGHSSNAATSDSPLPSYKQLKAVMDSIGVNPYDDFVTAEGSGLPVIICHDREDVEILIDALGAKTDAMSGADKYRWGIPIKISPYMRRRADGGIDVVKVAKGEYGLIRIAEVQE